MRSQGGPIEPRGRAIVDDESGLSLVELVAALSIIAIGFLAMAGAASTAARMLLQGKQRQAAAATAERQVEHIRNIPYEHIALTEPLTTEADPSHPDAAVGADGTSYDHDGDGAYEPLVISPTGQVPHVETFTVGTTALTVYQYITWVDDPAIPGAENYKRITIVAWMDAPAGGTVSRTVSVSTLITGRDIRSSGEPLGPTDGVVDPSPDPTPTGTPPSCIGIDILPPVGEFTIASGTGALIGHTASTSVTILLSITDTCVPIRVRLSNDGVNFSADIIYDPANPTVTWSLATGDGVKNVWAMFTDAAGNFIVYGPESIILDQTIPTSSSALNLTVACIGNDRTVSLTWTPSVDANLVGYRVYRSIDDGPWSVVATTAVLTAVDRHLKTLDSVRYRAVGYDKAGNESVPVVTASLSKNQCL